MEKTETEAENIASLAHDKWRRKFRENDWKARMMMRNNEGGEYDLAGRFDDLPEELRTRMTRYAAVAEKAALDTLIAEWNGGKLQQSLRLRQKVVARMLETEDVSTPYYGDGVETGANPHLWRLAEIAVDHAWGTVLTLWAEQPNHPRWKKR